VESPGAVRLVSLIVSILRAEVAPGVTVWNSLPESKRHLIALYIEACTEKTASELDARLVALDLSEPYRPGMRRVSLDELISLGSRLDIT
jgi:hypothetical protein